MQSREESVLEVFFKSGKYWHFDEIVKFSDVCQAQVGIYLKKFAREGLILRVKKRGKMPYYVQNFENPAFQTRKRLYALNFLAKSGLLDHLASLKEAKVVILFGSFSRWDWHKESDIDIFIYGKSDNFEVGKYEIALRREIQVHEANSKIEMKKMSGMLPYIIEGDFIKGSIKDLGVEIHAKS